jgi:hypothetical protein
VRDDGGSRYCSPVWQRETGFSLLHRIRRRSIVAADNAELWERKNRLPTHASVRAFLESAAKRRILFTYQEVAKALDILPPHSIHQVTEALERLMEEDAAADRPFIAALAISKARGGLPAPRFFDCAGRLGRFTDAQDARTFHAAELNAVFARWGGSRNN